MTMPTLAQKVKIIKPGDGRGLDDLDLNPGEMVGFDNADIEKLPLPFIIAKVEDNFEGLTWLGTESGGAGRTYVKLKGIPLIHKCGKYMERYLLETQGSQIHFLPLRPPYVRGIPDFVLYPIWRRVDQEFPVRNAYVGREQIIDGLKSSNYSHISNWAKKHFFKLLIEEIEESVASKSGS